MKKFNLIDNDKLYANFKTNVGNMLAELYWQKAPQTVKNFVGLATGTIEWHNKNTGKKTVKPLYNNTIFHRVIPNFMIQGGDPQGTGVGGPGYKFNDEFHDELTHNSAGILSMANSGPNTNGSQFFIIENPTPHLDNIHSVFGKIIKNIELISKIAQVKTNHINKPIKNIILMEIIINKTCS